MYKVLVVGKMNKYPDSQLDWSSLECQITAEVRDGQQASLLIDSLRPDIVISGMNLPGKTGVELAQHIHQMQYQTRVIFVTEHNTFESARAAVTNGAVDYLPYPFSQEMLRDAVIHAVELIKGERENNRTVLFSQIVQALNCANDLNATNRGYQNSTVAKIIDYLQSEYQKDISLEDAARLVRMNPSYVSRLVKHETGKHFVEILRDIRIDEAKKLLTDPSVNMYRVAEMVGIADPKYFSLLFRKVTGMTPSEYRLRQNAFKKLQASP